nr:oxidoreductase [Propionibacteriales bacterium]
MSGLVDEIAASAAIAGVPSALASARDGIDALLRDRGLRRTTPALVSESLLQGAAASARLEGSQTCLEELRNGEGDEVATSAARLNAELLSLIPVVARSPLQALARMHTVVALDRVHPERLGRPRPAEGLGAGLQALSA